MTDNRTIHEIIIDTIKTAYRHNHKTHPERPFNRDVFREVARELNLVYRSDSLARKVFGSWGIAVDAALKSISKAPSEDNLEQIASHNDCNFPYLTKRVVPCNKTYRILVLPDIHVPFHSKPALNAAIKLGEEFQPNEIVQLGDLMDCFSLSRFPKSRDRSSDIVEELKLGNQVLKEVKERTGAKRGVFIEGNHEARIRKFIFSKVPQLGKLKSLNVDNLLELADIGWDFIPEHRFYAVNNVHFTHGEFTTQQASKKHVDEYRETIIHGHTHRISCRYHRGLSRTVEGWEMGTLCSMEVAADYVKHANWQHCVGTVIIRGDKYWINSHHIQDGVVEYNGKILDGNIL